MLIERAGSKEILLWRGHGEMMHLGNGREAMSKKTGKHPFTNDVTKGRNVLRSCNQKER